MKLFIPTIGTHLKLLKDHQFQLYDESRNTALLDNLEIKRSSGYGRVHTSSACYNP